MLLYSVLVWMLHRCEPEKETCELMTYRNHDQTVKNDISILLSVTSPRSHSKPLWL